MLRCVTAAVTATCAGLALVAVTAPAAAVVPPGVQHVTSVTVFLKSPDPAGLTALAGAHGLSQAQRLRALTALVPSASTRRSVRDRLADEGLTITGETAWSVTAGGSAGAIASRFGTRPKAGASPSRRRLQAATGALPSVPSALRSAVTAAFPTNAGPAVAHHSARSSLDGTDVRNAYSPAGSTPSTGQNDAGTTIATLQLADFRDGALSDADTSTQAADLTSYAQEHGLPDPVADGQYQAVPVDGGPSADDDLVTNDGDVEVDLDQESILSTAPTADQHAYFAPNTNAGFADVFAAVFDDVTGTAEATAPDPHITALSSSWGECESASGSDVIASVEPILESLAAAGVTVFSASGDDGIYDCGQPDPGFASQADVDFPASSPYVVAVGGTNLAARTSAPNTGSNWAESAWSCTDAEDCEVDSGGSGGGASGSAHDSSSGSFAGFAAPAYQTAAVRDAPFAGAGKRLVPDIAADADPVTGFVVHTSNPTVYAQAGSADVQVGGTSLASPISAAQFDNALGDKGYTSGVGDIHDALYSAYAKTAALAATSPAKVFRDVSSGSNGSSADRGTDPSVRAQAGYDTVTGLGAVLWPALVGYLRATGRPTASASMRMPNATKSTATYTVAGAWQVSAAGDDRAVARTVITVATVGGATAYRATSSASAGSFQFTGKPGRTYRLSVVPTDLAGTSATGAATLVTPVDDRSFTFSKKWTRVVATTDFGGSHAVASARTASARISAQGRTFSVRVRTGPNRGRLGVYLAGRRIATINEYNKNFTYRLVRVYTRSTSATRTLTFRPLGQKSSKSSSTAVDLDSLTVTR